MAFIHVWNVWLAAGPRDHPINAFIRASNSTSLKELQRFLQNPNTIQQLTYIDPTNRLTHQLTNEQREDLLVLPHVLRPIYESSRSKIKPIKHAHKLILQKSRSDFECYINAFTRSEMLIPGAPPISSTLKAKRYRQQRNYRTQASVAASAAQTIQKCWRRALIHMTYTILPTKV